MAFKKRCGPCHGSGYYGSDSADICKTCKGLGEVELIGSSEDYRRCGPCHGSGYHGSDPKATCSICGGVGVISTSLSTKQPAQPEGGGSTEAQILKALHAILPSAAASYEQAVLDLRDESRKSMRGTAVELREALREVLDHLAPASEVSKMPGFTLESDQTRPTMRQKARFILRSRGSPEGAAKSPEDAVSVVDELVASLVRSVYQSGSLMTHVASARARTRQLRMYVDTVLAELLEIHEEPNEGMHAAAQKPGGG